MGTCGGGIPGIPIVNHRRYSELLLKEKINRLKCYREVGEIYGRVLLPTSNCLGFLWFLARGRSDKFTLHGVIDIPRPILPPIKGGRNNHERELLYLAEQFGVFSRLRAKGNKFAREQKEHTYLREANALPGFFPSRSFFFFDIFPLEYVNLSFNLKRNTMTLIKYFDVSNTDACKFQFISN